MRSRYTAYSLANIDYIKKTMRGNALLRFQEREAMHWAKRVTWLSLKVLHTEIKSPLKGYVEFIALFIDGGFLDSIHEKSEFTQERGQWYYVDGIHLPPRAGTSKQAIARNHFCPCGSRKKFKHCHGK